MSVDLREQQILLVVTQCRHFNGVQHEACDASVNYRQLTGLEVGMAKRLPCGVSMATEPVACEKRQVLTRAEAEAQVDGAEKVISDAMTALTAVHLDMKARGLGRGHGGTGAIACPVCAGGTINYRVAAPNGHTMARCTTDNCVRWIE